MAKIHLLLKKEEIDEAKLNENKVAVVFDVLLATSTIVSVLQFGAKEVIPVLHQKDAKEVARKSIHDNYILVGEYGGKTIDGFLPPNPLYLKEKVKRKTVILSTTNGTVAIKKCTNAKKIFVASLLNARSIASALLEQYKSETIVIVCAGSSGEFNIEDFYGAGSLISSLIENDNKHLEMTDAALAAYLFYLGAKGKGEEILSTSHVGKILKKYGLTKEIKFVAQEGIYPIVPCLENDGTIVKKYEYGITER